MKTDSYCSRIIRNEEIFKVFDKVSNSRQSRIPRPGFSLSKCRSESYKTTSNKNGFSHSGALTIAAPASRSQPSPRLKVRRFLAAAESDATVASAILKNLVHSLLQCGLLPTTQDKKIIKFFFRNRKRILTTTTYPLAERIIHFKNSELLYIL